MKSSFLSLFLTIGICAIGGTVFGQTAEQKPATPVAQWTGKTVMLIGAHADDDALSHGTLAMLQAHGHADPRFELCYELSNGETRS